MINTKFSIIIPNYNKGKLIKNCLNSIFNQTIEYFYLADKYPLKKDLMLRRINLEEYYKKIDKLYNWCKNSNLYTYKEYLQ